jgi:hypothetical protein
MIAKMQNEGNTSCIKDGCSVTQIDPDAVGLKMVPTPIPKDF